MNERKSVVCVLILPYPVYSNFANRYIALVHYYLLSIIVVFYGFHAVFVCVNLYWSEQSFVQFHKTLLNCSLAMSMEHGRRVIQLKLVGVVRSSPLGPFFFYIKLEI